MSGFISTVTELVNAIFVGGTGTGASASWISSVVACINANPILLIGFVISVACLGVGVVKRLTRLG